MAPTTATRIRVHDAEVSTDRESLAPYVEPLGILLALLTLAAAAWISAQPSQFAELQQPSQATGSAFDVGPAGTAGTTSTTLDAGNTTRLAATFAAPLVQPLQGPPVADATPDVTRPRQGPVLPPYLP